MQNPRAYNTGLIAAMLTMLAVAVVTGVVLVPAYAATSTTAYTTVLSITRSPVLGLARSMHHWSSALLIVFGGLYVIVGLFRGAYQKPGQWLWISSIFVMLVGLAMQLTGHLLPFDQQAVRTAVVETGIAANAPVIGTMQGNLMRGGTEVGEPTLHLWYLAHVTIFMIVAVALSIAVPRLAKNLGTSVWRRGWVIGAFVLLLIVCVAFRPPLGAEAGATDMSDQGARPEWYILPLHSLLVLAQSVKPEMAFIGTMVIPGLALLLLIALPWIHRRESIPIARTLGALAALALGGLFFYSFRDVAPPVGEQIAAIPVDQGYPGIPKKLDPKLIAQGRDLFDAKGCRDCHRINGKGNKIGPDLSNEGAKQRSLGWQVKHLMDPKSMSPGSTMPPYKALSKEQLDALAQYLNSLGLGNGTQVQAKQIANR